MNYKRANIIGGWISFIVAAIVYLSTIPPTTSFWDCGEFIATAYKLEVCHSPGAPLFMIIARFFTMFAKAENAALMINAMSALASAFTILFLFWTITHLAKKILVKRGEISPGRGIAIIGAGLVGALSYTFSDTFWFSAVEGEVYALSSLFTAVVFWAILKWENIADQEGSNRWLILIAFLIGLSIGVHLLNLLAIPAIVFVYYFKKYKTTPAGIVIATIISVVLLGAIMYFIIPYTVIIASWFERLFVNSFGMPFNSGVIFFAILLLTGLIYGIWRTHKKGKILANTILLGVSVIIMGYSSYAMTIIRSTANPPMDQNDPEDLFSLLGYLNREQYGDRPLLNGQYFSAPVIGTDTKTSYRKSGDKYEKYEKGFKYIFDERFSTFFPRMYDSDKDHVREYKKWANIEGTKITVGENDVRIKPTFGENLRFFFTYQIGFMYGRYFMWNFVGRQNDIQGHGEVSHGNWLSGIKAIDESRLGPQDDLPEHMKNHNARNTYYFLPLILGLIGLIYQYSKHKKDFVIVMLLFILTGLAIVVYLNQYPLQPRERDYAYAGSFYAFTIWIGLGVLAIYDGLRKLIAQYPSAVIATGLSLVAVPVLMASENWDDHDRSGRYTARDFAHNYLNSCDKNGILFTNGDNDTFPLWYIQEVEEERTDVRIICLPYLTTDWYIDQLKRKAYDSDPVPFSMDHDKYKQGTRDMIFVQDMPNMFINEKYEASKFRFKKDMLDLLSQLVDELKKGNFVQKEAQTFQRLNEDPESITPIQMYSLAKKLTEDKLLKEYNLNKERITNLENKIRTFIKEVGKAPTPLKDAMDFVASDDKNTKVRDYSGDLQDILPGTTFTIPVDKEKVIANGTVQPEDTAQIVDYIEFSIDKTMIYKSDIMILDLLANFNWDRPLYFSTIGRGTFKDLKNYAQQEGFAYRLVPIKNKSGDYGRINTRLLYDNFFNKFMYRNLDNQDVHLGWTNVRTISVVRLRREVGLLAAKLNKEGKHDKAIAAVDSVLQILPHERIPIDYMESVLLDQYFKAGDKEKGKGLLKKVFATTLDELDYFLMDNNLINLGYQQDQQLAVAMMHTIISVAQRYKQKELLNEFQEQLKEMFKGKSPATDMIEQYSKEQIQLIQIFFNMNNNNINNWFRRLPQEDQQFINSLNNMREQDLKIMQLYVSWIL